MPIRGSLNHETVTVSTTPVGITTTASKGVLPAAAEITVEGAAIRYHVDGTDPAADEGTGVEIGGVVTLLDRGEVTMFRAIRRDGADATLRVSSGISYVA